MANSKKYAIEWRDKNGVFKQQLQPWAKDVKWQWNRKGGCGRASIRLAVPYRKHDFSALDDIRIFLNNDAVPEISETAYAHFKCNDNLATTNVLDAGSGDNDGTASANTSTLSSTGKIGTGLAFTGDGGAINIDIDAILATIASDTTGTIGYWFNGNASIGYGTVISFGDTDAVTYLTFGFSGGGTGVMYCRANIAGTTQWQWTSTETLDLAKFYHFAISHNGTEPTMYINGIVAAGTFSVSTDKTVWLGDIGAIDNARIGCRNFNSGGNSLHISGTLDDLRYYREALAASDIDVLYNSGNGTERSKKDPVPVYRGWVAGANPVLKDNQEIVLDIRGYFDRLKYIVVQDSGILKSYTSELVSDIVDDIIDTFVVANTDIIKGTIDTSGFTADAMDFKGSVESALKTLADLEGGVEYGVDENLFFFWRDEGTTVSRKFLVGDNIKVLQRKEDFSKIINKYYLEGKQTAGVPYTRDGENTSSQASYFLSERIVQNSAISTNSVADQYISALLNANDAPKFQMNLTIPNTNIRLEDTIPIGKISIYDAEHDEFSASRKIWGTTYNGGDNVLWGTTANGGDNFLWGGGSGVFQDQVDFIRYQLSETDGRFTINIGMGGSKDESAGIIKQIQLDLQNLRQGRT